MRALRLCGGPASVVQRLGTSASAWAAACALSRRLVSDDAAAALADLAENDGDDANTDGLSAAEPQEAVEEAASHKNQQPTDRSRPLVSKLLPYVYGASTGAAGIHLPVPRAHRPLQRMQRLLEVGTSEELQGVVEGAHLEADADCANYVNLVVAYIRHEGNLDHLEGASSAAMRRRAEKTRAHEKGLYLTPEEQNMLLRKACLLVEQRRVSLVVASRLLRHRWPAELHSHGGPNMQRYLTDLVRNWTAEELLAQRLTPSDARAVLLNCAVAFKSQLRQARASDSTTNSNDETGTRVPIAVTEEKLAALIGSLATTAVADTASPGEAEGIIAVMWAVHHSSCPAPMSFWNAMVRRVVQLNASLDGPLLEPTPAETQPQRARSRGTCSPTATATTPVAGHFFSGLTTRQLYRFLEVLKLVKWSGDVAVLHQLADQTLRNVAFELEAMPLRSGDDKPNKDAPAAAAAATARSDTTPSASLAPAANGEKDIKDASQKDALKQAKRDVTRRIRLVADMSPREFFKLLALAADLRVPFGVSATRVSEELLAPLVPHLSTRDLLMLLQIVRHTQSQSAELLQNVMRHLIEMGPAIPYALTLSKTLIRTAATTPDLFASLQMDAFVHFFLDLCEAQFSLCQPTQVASLADVLYTLGRHYDDASEPGQRIRAVVNLFCTHMDRLLQLHVINTSLVEPLLEATVLLRMRPHSDLYPSVQDLLQTRTAATEKREARRAFVEERRVRAMEEAARRREEGGAAASDRLGPRWEDVPEIQLPQLSKAAIAVYEEVAYMFERMVVIKAKLNGADFHRFDKDLEKAGLFSLLHGAQLYQQGHLDAQVAHTTPSAKAAAAGIPRTLPRWMEKTINTIVHRKLRRCGITAQSSDNDVLKLLGHVHCDAAKVDVVVALIVDSPLHLLKHQRPLWLYVSELARRFGSEETQRSVATYLSKSLF